MTKIKICGITRVDDAGWVVAAGADFVGLNFWPQSKRYLAADRAPAVAAAARAAGLVQLVGVFVNAAADDIAAIARGVNLDVIQLHGDETAGDAAAIAEATGRPVWKAIAVREPGDLDLDQLASWPVEAFLLDAPVAGRGGGGKVFDWNLAAGVRSPGGIRRIVLAGGLGPHNVSAAIAAVAPWAVDVASGVESAPGIKDRDKVAAFIAAARAADARAVP